MGGSDPYSASKAAAELVIKSYINSYFSDSYNIHKIGVARAGNVIGGGDWSKLRLIPDCIRSWADSKSVNLRSPNSTRPWQHVLEPLSGYLKLATQLSINPNLHGEAFNFGPSSHSDHSVLEVVQAMAERWEQVTWTSEKPDELFKEAGLLKLNCDKALAELNWKASLNFEETIQMTADWYKHFYEHPDKIFDYTLQQINTYQSNSSKVIN